MGHKEHKEHSLTEVRCAVLTVSDTRTPEGDTSGRAIVDILRSFGHDTAYHGIVIDDIDIIRSRVGSIMDDEWVQALVLNGGTGVARRDVTIEAVQPLIDKELPGFGEIFRMLSYEKIGSAAMMSRAIAGTCKGKAIFCIPGSEKACHLAVSELIGPELGHVIWEVIK